MIVNLKRTILNYKMSTSSKKIVLKKLQSHNTIWHPESTLVFKSQKDKIVIGRYVDDEIIPLDDNALQLCELWKFKPDESLIDQENEDKEPENESQDEEEEETPKEAPKETPKEAPKDDNVVKSLPSIKNITENFTLQLYSSFDNLLEEKLSLTEQLNQKEAELVELQKKYDDFKRKFDAMKSLFS